MGEIHEQPEPAALFFGLLADTAARLESARERLADEFGRIIRRSDIMDFTHSDYYESEMGGSLLRQWALTERLIGQEEIVEVKRRTNEIEQEFAADTDHRRVNIDPGYLNLSKVVLGTTKDYSHRLYIGRGIYAEVTLAYRSRARGYEPWPWTYPDYREPAALAFFSASREEYKNLRKCLLDGDGAPCDAGVSPIDNQAGA